MSNGIESPQASHSLLIGEIAKALAEAQGEMSGARKGSANPFFQSRYADLAAVIGALREPLAKHGIAHVQIPGSDEIGVYVDTMLIHSSGEWIKGRIYMNPPEVYHKESKEWVSGDTPQGRGSVISYMRRYALQAMCGLEAEDDDGEKGMRRDTHARPKMAPLKPGTFQNVTPPDTGTARESNEKPPQQRTASAETPKAPETRQAPAGAVQSWQDVVCHIGKANGPLKDKALGKLATSSLEWLETQMGKKDKPTKQDLILTAALAMWRGGLGAATELPLGTPNRDMLKAKCEALKIPLSVVATVSRTLGGAAKTFDEIPDDECQHMLSQWEETANLIKDEMDTLPS